MRIIRGRKAVITGAASGIGRAIALALAAEGADLYLIDRDADGLARAAQEAAGHGVAVVSAECDLTDTQAITQTIGRLRAQWDSVHILVNCAGVLGYGLMHILAEQDWRQTMAVNLLAPMQIVHETIDMLLRADEAHILNVCSIAGLVASRKLPAYHASKFGLVGFTLALRNDYHRENFGVTALCPGVVHTPMMENASDPDVGKRPPVLPAFLMSTPEAVAKAALTAIRRNKGLVVFGALAKLSWWAARLSPGLVEWLNREGWRRRGKIEPPKRGNA